MSTTPFLNTIRINPSLFSFKPRQVLLAKPNPKPKMKKALTPVITPEQNALLLRSLAGYLKHNRFSKTLKKFLSEAQIEKDDFSDCSLDLEQMYCKYLETCDNSNGVSSKKVLEKDADSERVKENESIAGAETISKKKKKRSGDKLTESEENEKKKSKEMKKSKMGPHSLIQEDELDDKLKNKKKSKGKLDSESLMNNVESPLEVEDKQETKTKESESETVKSKGKKKTVDGSISKNSFGGDSKVIDEQTSGKTESKSDCNKTSEEEATEKERKGSKKRKRLASDENKSEPADNTEVEESKRRKTEEQEDSKSTSDQINGNLEKKEEKSASNKTMKKQENGSAEPKSVKVFQRVKIEEVVFTDERLKDNSYWAKDGAEIGYGAKAQEVLGQVRGRDFRHEKTKKKRGSYRGGMIDLQSHSVKFNYSDEE